MIIIPIKWLFHWEYTLFSDKPIWSKSGRMLNSIRDQHLLQYEICMSKLEDQENIKCIQVLLLIFQQTNQLDLLCSMVLTILGPTQKPQFQATYDARLSNSFMLKNLGVFNLGTVWSSNTAGNIIQVREVVESRIFADAYVVSPRTDSTKIEGGCPQKNDRNLRSPVPKVFTHNFI